MFIHLLRSVSSKTFAWWWRSLACRAIGNEEEEEEKKREEEAARSSNRGARVSVCVDGRGHHRRRPTHKTFPILYKTNDKRKLSSRLSKFAFCVSRPTTEAKHHHHHHHGWRRRAREAHEGTTTRPHFFSSSCIGWCRSASSFLLRLSKTQRRRNPNAFFFSTIRDYYRFQKEEGE